jgi:hypothetical protein
MKRFGRGLRSLVRDGPRFGREPEARL